MATSMVHQGSSAGLSDTEILNIKAPLVVRKNGRPKVKSFRSKADIASKKLSNRSNITHASSFDREESLPIDERTVPKNKNSTKCNTRSKRKTSDSTLPEKNAGLPVQTSFCTKCRKAGHNRNRCDIDSIQTLKKAKNPGRIVCSKCGLKGHIREDCLVADAEDSFFK